MTSWGFCMLATFEGQNNTQLPNGEEPHLIHQPLLKAGMATDEEGGSSGTNCLSFMGILITTWCGVVQLLSSSNLFGVMSSAPRISPVLLLFSLYGCLLSHPHDLPLFWHHFVLMLQLCKFFICCQTTSQQSAVLTACWKPPLEMHLEYI